MIFFPPLLSELYMCLGKTLVLIDLRFHLALGIQTYILDFTYILIVEVTLTNIFFSACRRRKGEPIPWQ
jgi:succinate dehydrogenase/fumarate reductase cytochrome b subunit